MMEGLLSAQGTFLPENDAAPRAFALSHRTSMDIASIRYNSCPSWCENIYAIGASDAILYLVAEHGEGTVAPPVHDERRS